MASFNVTVKFSGPLLGTVLNKEIMPRVHEAVGAIANATMQKWQNDVMQAKGIWSVERLNYVKSIKWQYTGDLQARIWSDYDIAGQIETGRPAKDLKKMLQTSSKVRIAKKGKHAGQKYLIIPMRHNTPGSDALAQSMPESVYSEAKQLSPSRVIGQTHRMSQKAGSTHLKLNKNVYEWGGKLPAGLAPKLKPSHKTDIYAGMRRFDTSSGKQKSSQYLTFRVMGQWSTGWIVPAKPGLYIAKKVADDMRPIAEKVIWAAVLKDAV